NTSADSPVGLNVGSVASGSTVAFSWTAENFADTYCLLSYDNNDQSYSGNLTPGNNGYNVSGSTVMSLGASSVSRQYKFFLRCSSPSTGKSHSRYAYVNVTAGPATLNLTTSVNGTAGAMAAKSGDTIVLAWTGTNINANSCVVSGPSGALLPSPSSGLPASSSANITVPTPTGATSVQYTLTCAATAGGNATASSQVINLSEIVGFITTSYNIPNPLRQGVAFNNSTTSPAIRLDWQVQNITSCTVERWYNDTTSGGTMSGTFSGASNKYDSPYTPLHNGTLVYRMTCSSPAGTLTKDTTPARNVLPPLLTCPNGTVTVFKDYSGTVVPAPAVVRGVANRFKVKITPATSAFKRNASSSYQIVTTNGVTATWAWTGAADTTEAYINLNGSGGVGAFTVRAINFDDAAVGGATGCNPSGPGTIADSTPIQAEDVAPQVLQSGVYAQSGTGYWVTNQGSNLTFSLLMRRATGSNWDFGAVPLVTPGPMLEKQDGTSVSGTFSTTSPTPDAALTYSFVCDATPTCPVKQYLTPTTISFSYQIRDGATVLATRTFNSQNFIVYPPVGVTLLINGVSDNVVYAPSGGVSTASWTLSNSSDDYLKNCRLNDGATNYTPSTTSASLGVISANTSTKINCGDVSPVTDANRRATDTTTINAVLPTNPNSYSSANASTAGLAVTPTVACTDTLVTFDLPGVPAGTSYLVAKGKPTSGSTDYTATRDSSGKYFILFPGLASGSAIDLWVEVGGVRSTTVNTTANVSTNCNFNLNNSDIEISKIGDTAATYTSYVACDGSQSTLADDSPEQKADGDITVQINLCNLTGQSATIKNTAADALDIKIHFINLFKSDGTDWNVNDVKIYDDTYNGNNEATAEITSKANCPWQTNTKTATTSTVCVRVLPTPQKIFPQYGVANRIWLARITGRLARATTVGSVWKTSASLEYPTILNADTGCTGNLAQSVTKRGCTNIDTKYQIYISGPLIERKEKK
ncbi:MAG TPA: hypothetical protein VEA59_06635, partial [Patescibacteria group bacterium]|nr:hypothetical protein [Patescibacteria group bacterium]